MLGGIIVLTALNLRTAAGSVPPLLDEIRRDVPLSAAGAGLLTTLPPLFMAAGAPLAPILARRLGHEAGLVLVALTIAAGIAARIPGGAPALFAGTVLASLGMAVGNVLVPAIIKRDFPHRIGLMTGLFTMAIAASGAIVAALVVPIEEIFDTDWRVALGVWALPALLVALAWAGLAAEGARAAPTPSRPRAGLLRNRVAVQVTLFMGFQSLSFFALLSWLPELLRDAGVERATAGSLLSIMLVTGIPTCLAVPVLAARRADQRGWVVATIALLAVGLVGLLVARDTAPLVWVVAAGAAQGSLLGLTFLFYAVRTPDATAAGRLAAMAHTFGFIIAALGPLTVGALRDATGGWTVPLVFLLAVLVPMVVFGLGAGKARLLSD